MGRGDIHPSRRPFNQHYSQDFPYHDHQQYPPSLHQYEPPNRGPSYHHRAGLPYGEDPPNRAPLFPRRADPFGEQCGYQAPSSYEYPDSDTRRGYLPEVRSTRETYRILEIDNSVRDRNQCRTNQFRSDSAMSSLEPCGHAPFDRPPVRTANCQVPMERNVFLPLLKPEVEKTNFSSRYPREELARSARKPLGESQKGNISDFSDGKSIRSYHDPCGNARLITRTVNFQQNRDHQASTESEKNQNGQWCDDIVVLTRDAIQFLEAEIGSENVIDAFKKGNDQINYGYTDRGLTKGNSNTTINFTELGTQLCYVYRFFSSHVLIIGELLLVASGWRGICFPPKKAPKVNNLKQVNDFLDSLFNKREVTISCFGGGPAAEVAAVAGWIRTEGITCPIMVNVLDKYGDWAGVAGQVAQSCSETHLQYRQLDFLTPNENLIKEYVISQDIIVMSKFLSALTAHRKEADTNLRLLLDNMKPGALLVFCDNSGGGTTKWVTRTAIEFNLTEVFSLAHYPAQVSPTVLGPNERRQLLKVKVTSALNVAFKIFRKFAETDTQMGQMQFYRNKLYHRIGQSVTSSF